jgi:hypothetical protein
MRPSYSQECIAVMARLPEWCDEAVWSIGFKGANEPPFWAEADRRLQGEGRRSRISQPSEAHRRFEIRGAADQRRGPYK